MQFIAVLKKPYLALLWASQVLSAMGDQLFLIALLWIAVKQVGSSAGIVTAAGSLAAVLFALLGGVFADRWRKNWTMIFTDIIRAIMVGMLPLLIWLGYIQFWHLLTVIIVVEALGALFDPTLQASLPLLTDDSKMLYTANTLMDASQRLARILGPGMAGVLLLILPLTHFFTLDAVSFTISALTLFAISKHFPKRVSQEPISHVKNPIVKDVGVAFHLLRKHSSLTWALVSLGLVNIAWSAAFTVGVPLLVSQRLHGNAGTYGLIVGAYGVGNILSLCIVSALPFRLRQRLTLMFVGEIVLGAGFLLLASASTVLIASLGAIIAAIGSPVGDLMLLTMIQTDFSQEHVGKIYSLRKMIGVMGLTCGMLLAAPLFYYVNISPAIALCAVFITGIGIVGVARFLKEHHFPVTSDRM